MLCSLFVNKLFWFFTLISLLSKKLDTRCVSMMASLLKSNSLVSLWKWICKWELKVVLLLYISCIIFWTYGQKCLWLLPIPNPILGYISFQLLFLQFLIVSFPSHYSVLWNLYVWIIIGWRWCSHSSCQKGAHFQKWSIKHNSTVRIFCDWKLIGVTIVLFKSDSLRVHFNGHHLQVHLRKTVVFESKAFVETCLGLLIPKKVL